MPDLFPDVAGSLELEPTAALVMEWAKDLYRTGNASLFCSRLDLSASHRMKQECDLICPWYPEVMMNRKWFIRFLATSLVSDAEGECQVVLLAAGKSPLALELFEVHPDRIVSVIETDIAGLEEKQEIYRAVAPEFADRIRCVHTDIYHEKETEKAIFATGMYDPKRPSVVVFEGISYYLPPGVSARVLSIFCSGSLKNAVILDSLLPCRLVREDRRYISRGIWGVSTGTAISGTRSPTARKRWMGCSHPPGVSRLRITQWMRWRGSGPERTGFFPPAMTDGSGSRLHGCKEGRSLRGCTAP